ncbi:hypothetical protein RN001_016056 [Aquatica leii]|uniref:Uncharacterized protein n=1 Tax=Aquatica leii TaxID=1421715 RepID=A0AAN7NX31_9COLE|nr:hypothetical protein RN001_016056 [Aquatica leii]
MCPNYTARNFFSSEEKQHLCRYLKTMANLHHGLTSKNSRKLAYELAIANTKKYSDALERKSNCGKRLYFKHHMIKNLPPGPIGAASPSGWITSNIFAEWFNHFINHAKPSAEAPFNHG